MDDRGNGNHDNVQQYVKWKEYLDAQERELEARLVELREREGKYEMNMSKLHTLRQENQRLHLDLDAREEDVRNREEDVRRRRLSLREERDVLKHERESLAQQDRMLAQRQVEIDRCEADIEARRQGLGEKSEWLKEAEETWQRRLVELERREWEVSERMLACEEREVKVEQEERDLDQLERHARGKAGELQSQSSGGWSQSGANSNSAQWPDDFPDFQSSADTEERCPNSAQWPDPAEIQSSADTEQRSPSKSGEFPELDSLPHLGTTTYGVQPSEASDLQHHGSSEDDSTEFYTAAQVHSLYENNPLLIRRKRRRDGILPAMRRCAAHYQYRRRIAPPALPNTLPSMPLIPSRVNARDPNTELGGTLESWWNDVVRADEEDMEAEARLLARFEQMCKAG